LAAKADKGLSSFAPVLAAFARDRSVTRGKMFSSDNVLSVNGKIFAMLVRGKLVVKLPKPRVDELVAVRMGDYFDPGHGRLMKQRVTVAVGKTPWVALAKEAYRYVGAVRPAVIGTTYHGARSSGRAAP
jgi:hypothetical protein